MASVERRVGLPTWRIGCARVPRFALAVARQAHPEVPPHAPVALIEEKGTRSRVAAADAEAQADGVQVGQAAARARAGCPGLVCLTWDPAALRQATLALAERLEQAAPLVVPLEDEPGAFWIDARGMRWLGGEDGLAARVLAEAAAAGFPELKLAVADTAVAARAAVRLPGAAAVRLVPAGGDAAFLARLPLDALDMGDEVRDALLGLGLRTVAELAALPPGALEARFGPEGRAALRRALGFDPRRPEGRPPAPLPRVALPLDEPVDHTAPLVFGLRGILDTLASRLIARGLSATRLVLGLRLDDRSERVETLEPTRPLHHPRALFELCRDRLERITVDSPVVELTVAVGAAQPAVAEQANLGAGRWDPRALEGALNRLHGRFGQAVVFTPEPRDDPRPEAGGAWQALSEVPLDLQVPEVAAPPPAPAPIRRALPEPVPLPVRLDAHGQPTVVRLAMGGWQTVRAHGPERLSGGWWDPAGRYAREDWRLVLLGDEGGVLWASRAGDGAWWLRGWWD
ncbi:MAG: DNA polymerase Y family protein [Myxococcales bacterium]|nr:DNA polymerase Y family protein [Myxococcales bacterium]